MRWDAKVISEAGSTGVIMLSFSTEISPVVSHRCRCITVNDDHTETGSFSLRLHDIMHTSLLSLVLINNVRLAVVSISRNESSVIFFF